MLRISPGHAVMLVMVLSAASIARPARGAPSAREIELVRQLKQLQQQQLMSEAHERHAEVWWRGESPASSQSGRPVPAAARLPGANAMAANIAVNDPNLDVPSRADGQSEPSIAAWGNYVLAGWIDGRGSGDALGATLSNDLNVAYSTDGGATFATAPATGPAALPVLPQGGRWTADPVIAVNEKTGDFYFCGMFDPPNNITDEHGVAVARATFSGTTITWTRPVVVRSVLLPSGFIEKPWIAVDSLSGNVYVTYTRFTNTQDSIVVTRSADRGLHWGPQITLSSAAAGLVEGSRPAVGPTGEVYVTWKEIALNGTGQDFMRIRRSNDFGVTWLPEHTAAAFFDNFGTGAPGYNREQGIALPSIAVDRSDGPFRGRVYVAWNECVNFYDSIPDTSNAPVLNEVEPNDSPAGAQSFTAGTALRGSFNSLSDFDYYQFAATQGTSYLFWANELPTRYTLRIFGADGVTRLAFSGDRINSPPNQGFIVWTCPQSGTYFMRMAIFGSTPGDYRVDTAIDTPGGTNQRARDQRDTFAAWSADGSAWSTPAMLSAPEPGLFDDWLPEIAVTGQGAVYALWYDFSRSRSELSGGESHCSMSRSDDGGDSWMSLGAVTDNATYWTAVNSNIIPNQGDYLSLFANRDGIYPCWTDGRLGNPDIRAAVIATDAVTPTLAALSSAIVIRGHALLTWDMGGSLGEATVERRVLPADWQPLAALSDAGRGLVTYEDATVLPGVTYRYRLAVATASGVRYTEETQIVVPVRAELALEGVSPNPTVSKLSIDFVLADTAPATLELVDLSGRRVLSRTLGSLDPGRHHAQLGDVRLLPAGMYFVRLRQGTRERTARIAIVK